MDDLLRRWQYGWGLCRGLAPAVDRPLALDVTLGLPHRDRELFALPGTTPAPLIDEVLHAPRPTWLTVTTQEPEQVAADAARGMMAVGGAALYRKLGWVPKATMLTARAA